MLFISSIIPISLARNKGSVFVPFITTSVCKSFVLNAFTISIFWCCNTILYAIYLSPLYNIYYICFCLVFV